MTSHTKKQFKSRIRDALDLENSAYKNTESKTQQQEPCLARIPHKHQGKLTRPLLPPPSKAPRCRGNVCEQIFLFSWIQLQYIVNTFRFFQSSSVLKKSRNSLESYGSFYPVKHCSDSEAVLGEQIIPFHHLVE